MSLPTAAPQLDLCQRRPHVKRDCLFVFRCSIRANEINYEQKFSQKTSSEKLNCDHKDGKQISALKHVMETRGFQGNQNLTPSADSNV